MESPNNPAAKEDSAKQATAETRKLFRGSSLMLAGRMLALIAGFVFQVLIVRVLVKEDYGTFAYILACITVGATFTRLGMEKPLIRFVPIYQEREQYSRMAGVILIALGTIFVVGLSLVAGVFIFHQYIASYFFTDQLSLTLLLLMIILVPMKALDNVLEALIAIFANARALFFRRHIIGPALKLSSVTPLIIAPSNIHVFVVTFVSMSYLGTAYTMWLLISVLRKKDLFKHLRISTAVYPFREVFSFGGPLLITDLAFVLRTTLVTFLLAAFHGPISVAAYRAVLPVARLNSIVIDSFKHLFNPAAARMFAREDFAAINRVYWSNTLWVAIATFPIFCVTFALSDPVTIFLFGADYANSGSVLAVLAFACYLNASFGCNALTLRVMGKVRWIFINDVLTAVAAVVFCALLIPHWDALGGALAAAGTLIVQNVLNQISLFRTGVIKILDGGHSRAFGSLIVAIIGLLVIKLVLAPPLIVAIMIAIIAPVLVLWANLAVLDVQNMFPETLRIPGVRRVFRLLGVNTS